MRSSLALLLALLAASCASTHARTPEALLRALYDAHKPQYERDIDFHDGRQLARFFSPELTALFLRDHECEQRTNEQCNLGFDPIFAAQDFDESPLDLAIEPLSATRFRVTFTNLGRRSQIYELIETPSGWRIDDVVYPEGASLKETLSASVPST